MDRRQFLKGLSGAVVAGTAASAGLGMPNIARAEGFGTSPVPKDKMTYRSDARGQKVSLLGFGMMRLPVENGEDLRTNPQANLDQEAINRMVDYAIDHGVNYFDTAPIYLRGKSEPATGIALSRHPRSKWLVATKMSNFRDWSYDASIEMYRRSFENLKVDYIDYYLLHSFGGVDEETGKSDFEKRFLDNGVLDFLLREREAGRIRNLGWSFHGLREEFDKVVAMHDRYHWDFAQIQMNYVDWHYAHEIDPENVNAEYLYNVLDSKGIPIVIMEPLLGGRLATLNDHLVRQLKEREPQRSVASWAFRYLGMYPRIMTALSGMNRIEHVEDNVASYAPLKPLTADDMTLLSHVADEFAHFPAIPCTGCNYCLEDCGPDEIICPMGINIPGIFAHYNKCLNEGNVLVEGNVDQREFQRARQAFLTSYDASVDRMRQADRCIDCRRCTTHCPQHIDIPAKLHMINEYTTKLKN